MNFRFQLREFYRTCVSIDVSEGAEFKEILQLLTFMSKDEILEKLRSVVQIIDKFTSDKYSAHATEFKENLKDASTT